MANLDFTPLFRSSVGFDRVPGMLQSAMKLTEADVGYPPYNIERIGDDRYQIALALAGFSKDDIDLTVERNELTIRGKAEDNKDHDYLHRGIAGRSFERRFNLAEHIEVDGATFENGLLVIDLKRELPEKLKPRQISIGDGSKKAETIEHKKDKAA